MKKIISFLLAFCICGTCPVFAEGELNISAPSAILIEASTGKILFEKNSHEKLPPASVTKVMTMLLSVEALDSGQFTLDDMVTCSEFAASMGGSQVYLEPGEQMPVRDMLKAIAVASGNDAAAAMGEFISGSNEAFIAKMNERAKELGMNDTHFVNCNGLDDPEHYTSAYDISVMSRELISHPVIFEFTSIWMDSLRDGKFGLVNTNKLIRFYSGATGLKTGSTSIAKYCLSASARRDNMDLIAVVLAAPSTKERFADATSMLNYGFATYALANNLVSAEELTPIKVSKGTKEELCISLDENFKILVEKTKLSKIDKKLNLQAEICAPVSKGEKVGMVEFFMGDEKIGEADVLANEDVNKLNVLQMFSKVTKNWILG